MNRSPSIASRLADSMGYSVAFSRKVPRSSIVAWRY